MIERVDVGNSSGQKEEDHAFGFGVEVRLLRRKWIATRLRRGSGLAGEHFRKQTWQQQAAAAKEKADKEKVA